MRFACISYVDLANQVQVSGQCKTSEPWVTMTTHPLVTLQTNTLRLKSSALTSHPFNLGTPPLSLPSQLTSSFPAGFLPMSSSRSTTPPSAGHGTTTPSTSSTSAISSAPSKTGHLSSRKRTAAAPPMAGSNLPKQTSTSAVMMGPLMISTA